MKTIFKIVLTSGLFFQLLLSPVFAGSTDIIANNQIKTNKYITLLKKGVDPDNVTRPQLRRHKQFRVKKAVREMVHAMDEAERLARTGKYKQIQKYNYLYKGKDIKTLQKENRN